MTAKEKSIKINKQRCKCKPQEKVIFKSQCKWMCKGVTDSMKFYTIWYCMHKSHENCTNWQKWMHEQKKKKKHLQNKKKLNCTIKFWFYYWIYSWKSHATTKHFLNIFPANFSPCRKKRKREMEQKIIIKCKIKVMLITFIRSVFVFMAYL